MNDLRAGGRAFVLGRRRAAAFLLLIPGVVLLLGGVAQAQADSAADNSQSYLVGGRAAGMGGAFTAIADDESGMFYNPAGLASAERSSLSLSVSLYGYVRGDVKDAIDVGSDYGYGGLNIVPSTVGWVKKLSSRATLALGVFAPSSLSYKDQRRTRDGDILVTSLKDETLWAGAALGLRLTERWSIGVSAFGLYRSTTDEITVVSARMPAAQSSDVAGQVYGDFLESRLTSEEQSLAWTALLGVRFQPTEWLAFGVSLHPGSFALWGEGKFLRTEAFGLADGSASGLLVSDGGFESTIVVPSRVALGVAVSRPRSYTFALDYSVLDAVDHPVADLNSSSEVVSVVGGTIVQNVNLGVELWPSDNVAVRTGFFTNRSGTPRDVIAGQANHVDQYGVSVGVGFAGDHTETTIGATAAFGAGDGYSVRYKEDTKRFVGAVVEARQLRLYAFVGTSYRF